MADTQLTNQQIKDAAIDAAKILDGTLTSTELATNADIAFTQLDTTGTLDLMGGALVLPQGASLPSQAIGKVFFKTDNDHLYVGNGTDMAAVAGNLFYTGIVTGGSLSINTGDNTKFDITAGEGVIVDNHTNPTNPVITRVMWGAFIAQTPAGILTDDFTYLAIDSTGSLLQQTSTFIFEQARDIVIIGRVGHSTHTNIQATSMFPRVTFNGHLEFFDFLKVFNAININGNAYSPNGMNLNINKSAGQSYRLGANYKNSKKRPSVTDDNAETAGTLFYTYQNGTGGWNMGIAHASVDPGFYDDGSGTLAAVSSAQFTIQTVLFFPGSNATAVQYGQALYTSLGDAEARIHDSILFNPSLDQTTFRAWLIVRGDATDLSDSAQAKFITAGKFGLLDVITGTSGGEANTASNIGAFGTGAFKQKSGVDLQFKNIAPASSKITVVNNPGNNDIDLDVVTTPSGDVVGTGRAISTTAPLTGGGDLSADRTLAVSAATTGDLGVVQVGTNISVALGVITIDTLITAISLQTTVTANGSGALNMAAGAVVLPQDVIASIPVDAEGKLFWATDTEELYVGQGNGGFVDPLVARMTVQEEGSLAGTRRILNFTGTSITASDDAGNNRINVALSQSPSGSATVVGTGRAINTSGALTGGGDLSVDRTLTVTTSPVSAGTVVGTGRVMNTTSPLRIDGGASADFSADRTLSVNDATTLVKGVVQVGTNVSVSSGVISVPTSPSGVPVGTVRAVNTTTPLTGGGDLSTDLLLAISDATTISKGIVQVGTNISVGSGIISVPTTPTGTPVGTGRAISTTAPLTGGGNLSADRTIAISSATTGALGVVRVGDNVSVAVGVISVTTLAVAIALNTTMTMNASGVLNCTSGSLRIPNGAPAGFVPSVAGRVFYDTTNNKLLVDNGTSIEKVAGWKLLASVSITGVAAATLSSGTILARKHLMVRFYIPSTSSSIIPGLRFNSDSGANYNSRTTENGANSMTQTSSANGIKLRGSAGTNPATGTIFVRNTTATPKAVHGNMIINGETAGTAPDIDTMAGMWDNTAAQITSAQLFASAGTMAIGTEMQIWGRDDE